MARANALRNKIVAASIAMAGIGSFAYSGGSELIHVAHAQRPAAPPPPVAAGAAPAKIDAKKTFAAGLVKFNAGDFAGALADFQSVDALKPTPQAAYHIGLCNDNLAHYPEAIAAYDRFLAAVPPKMASQGEEIKRRTDAIKALPGKVHIETTPPGATVLVDGVAAQAVTPTDVEVPAGKHTFKLTADNRVGQERALDVTFASKQDLKVELEEKAAPPPAVAVADVPPPPVTPPPALPVEPPPANSLVPALVTGGLAVAALGVGTVFGVMALSDKSDFKANPTSSKADDGENHALIADMAFGVAVTLGVTSAVLFLGSGKSATGTAAKLEPAKPKTKSFTITPTPYVTAHGGGAGALVRF